MAFSMAQDNFDYERLLKPTSEFKTENGDVSLSCYVSIWEELCKLMKMFGTQFDFAITETMERLGVLQRLVTTDPEHYDTVGRMVAFETLHSTEEDRSISGISAIAGLQGGLLFFAEVFEMFGNVDSSCNLPDEVNKCYEKSLKHVFNAQLQMVMEDALDDLPPLDSVMKQLNITNPSLFTAACGETSKKIREMRSAVESLIANKISGH